MARAKRKAGHQPGCSPQARPYRKSNSLTPQQELAEISDILPGQVPVSERVRELARGELYHGPIPHPDIFRGYGEVVPDAPERILRVFEQDSAHARDIQNSALRLQWEDNRRIHWMAYSLIAGDTCSLVFSHIWTRTPWRLPDCAPPSQEPLPASSSKNHRETTARTGVKTFFAGRIGHSSSGPSSASNPIPSISGSCAPAMPCRSPYMPVMPATIRSICA